MLSESALRVRELVGRASECLNFYWPLESFIACNPLKGFESMPFEEALRSAARLFGSKAYLKLSDYRSMYETGRINPANLQEAFKSYAPSRDQLLSQAEKGASRSLFSLSEKLGRRLNIDLVSIVNRQCIKWCGAYYDDLQAQWKMPETGGFYLSWKELSKHDLSLSLYSCVNWKQNLRELSDDPFSAVEFLFEKLGVAAEEQFDYLRAHLRQLPGWASYLKWQDRFDRSYANLVDYLAIRLFYEWQICSAYGNSDTCSENAVLQQDLSVEDEPRDYAHIWQEAYELNYRDRLLRKLSRETHISPRAQTLAQLVFCIDVRSEPVRRRLERVGPYETFGFAGFFGVATQYKEFGSKRTLDLCPVLISPKYSVSEKSGTAKARELLSLQALTSSILQLKKKLKSNIAGAFGFVESFGLFSALPLVGRTILPRIFQRVSNDGFAKLNMQAEKTLDLSNIPDAERVDLAESNLRAISLTENFAPLLVLCGHRSESQNNPFASSLECGACGANSGGVSARIMAAILNDLSVREALVSRGIVIPDSSIFVAAEHNTCTDRFEFFDEQQIPASHRVIFNNLRRDLELVGELVAVERSRRLPASAVAMLNRAEQRACDWAQVAPEWGLAGNAAFVVGPRSLTEGLDLEGRVFLHSYNPDADPDLKILELIMTAPLVVAQWINAQYYFSTVDNDVYGSGSKTTHNVVGSFAVMQGASSDLKIGLPLQSVNFDTDTPYHEPMRLLVLINAGPEKIDRVLSRHEVLVNLLENRWIRLLSLDPDSGQFSQAEKVGVWRVLKVGNKELSPLSSAC